MHAIQERNKIMRDSSLDIATLVAYTKAEKEIHIKNKQNKVIATTSDNNLKVGDVILGVDNKICEEVEDIKNIIKSKEVGDTITFKVFRDNKEKEVQVLETKWDPLIWSHRLTFRVIICQGQEQEEKGKSEELAN